jgi:hypothetical protein
LLTSNEKLPLRRAGVKISDAEDAGRHGQRGVAPGGRVQPLAVINAVKLIIPPERNCRIISLRLHSHTATDVGSVGVLSEEEGDVHI